MDWSYKECKVTITTSKDGPRFRSVVKILRPHTGGEILLMMGNAFPAAELAENFGKDLARE